MSSRLKILIAVFVVGIIASAAMMRWTETGQVWRATQAREAQKVDTAKAVAARAASRPASRPTTRRRTVRVEATTLLRELPRQAMLITAAEEFGLAARDRSIDFAGVAQDAPISCELDYQFGGRRVPKAVVRDTKGADIATIEFEIPTIGSKSIDYAKLAAVVEPWCETQFAPLLAKATGKPMKAAANAPADGLPDGVEELLQQVDAERAFLAAHILHQAVAESGESPERLAGLVRAYSHLGESTRYLYSPHTSAFFARALIYAERLARKHPQLPLSQAARGYAYTLLGQRADGRAAFDRARELAGKDVPLPKWGELADDLNRFRTRRLFDETANGKSAVALASYFMLLTVEHARLDTVVINAAKLAYQHNPGALRVINIMNDNSGVILQHQTTVESTATQFRMLADLAVQPAVPTEVKAAATRAGEVDFAANDVLTLLQAMDKQAPGTGQLLPWGAFASVSRDALFAGALRRVYFAAKMYGTDPSQLLQAWWPYVKDHRFAPLLAGFDKSGALGSKQAAEEAGHISRRDLARRLPWLKQSMKLLSPEFKDGLGHYDYTNDDTGYDMAGELWAWGGERMDGIALVAMAKGEIAKTLAQVCPDHPAAIAELIVNRWPETRDRAAQIEKDFGSHPQVAEALARAYASEKRYDDAIRLYEQVLILSPDRSIYADLATIYWQQNKDDERWLQVYEKYLATTEDFALDHASVNRTIANAFLRMKKPDRALRYAQAAAVSYSQWGLDVYAVCLTELGRFDEADQILEAVQERYTPSVMWYRWCRLTGHGRIREARDIARGSLPTYEKANAFTEIAIFYALEGDRDRAREYRVKAVQADHSPYDALELALLHIEDGDTDAARKALDPDNINFGEIPDIAAMPKKVAGAIGNVSPPIDGKYRANIYRAAVKELQACVDNTVHTPDRANAELKIILEADGSSYKGTTAYVMGRVCELRDRKDDAIFWYEQSLDCGEWNQSARPLAAVALKRLGKPRYK